MFDGFLKGIYVIFLSGYIGGPKAVTLKQVLSFDFLPSATSDMSCYS
jgi:hypothetical protein